VLVTGGTGYLGRAIVAELARRGHEPTVYARGAAQASDLAWPAIGGDIRDHHALRRAVRGMTAVVHSAALVSVWHRDRAEFDRVNVGGLETLIDVCTLERIERIVVTSSFLALPPAGAARPIEANDYQRSKVRAREMARTAATRGVPIISIVPGVVYGPGIDSEGNLVARLFRDHLAGRLPGVIGADCIWSFAFVDDVARAHVDALERGIVGSEYVVGGENVPQMRAFELLRDLHGAALPRRLPRVVAYLAAAVDETLSARWRPPSITTGTVRILTHDWPLNSQRSIDELSYRITPLENGIERVLADFI
jgi:nucleoside-diphosphate-sugar epimerase